MVEMYVCFHDGAWDIFHAEIPATEEADPPKELTETLRAIVKPQIMEAFGEDEVAFFEILPYYEEPSFGSDEEDDYEDEYDDEEEEEDTSIAVWVLASIILVLIAYMMMTGEMSLAK
jgi:hypothetical protein